MYAGGQLTSVAGFPQAEAIAAVQDAHFPTPSADDDYDDLYGDVNLDFLLLPRPSLSPTSPPKTPSPGLSVASQSPPPHRNSPAEPQPDPEPTPQHEPPLPAPKPPTPQHHPPLPMPIPKPPTPRHRPPLLAPKLLATRHQPPQQRAWGGSTSSSSPPTAALYIGDLPWWTTDAEVEAALAPHGALHGLHFSADKHNGKSRGFCRADFLHPAAAVSAAAALHGRTFHGHHCVASLSCPPALHRPGADFDAPAPNPTLGRGGNASNLTTARGNVGLLGDQPALVALPRPMAGMAPRPRAFGAMMRCGGGYCGFPSVGQCYAGMGTEMMPSVVAPHVNPAFLAASRMAMGGTGMWHDQGMAGGLRGGQQPWNYGRREMSWQQPRLQQHQRQAQQQYRNGDYGKMRGIGRERPGGRNEERDIGNVQGNPDRRQCGRDGDERPRDHKREVCGRYREHVLEKERDQERNCDERDRHGGEKRRHQEYTERDDWERRGRARSRSQSRDSDDDDHPRRRR